MNKAGGYRSTEIATGEGKLYLATVEDLFSRRILGYATSAHHDAALTVAALQMAAVTRGGRTPPPDSKPPADTVQSVGRVGCAIDNAAAEPFNSTLKVEFVHRHRFTTRDDARLAIATWIADFYNTRRRHGANDGLPPIGYEQRITAARAATRARTQGTIAA
ncbi:integrase core domain-containing protein [Nonomuraea muscovyensis]|uniref:integrase core domain-containing protein n=1 Tax=Nonomuraea muscovyensis TaxID=1124761 RepID=UPI00340CCEDA